MRATAVESVELRVNTLIGWPKEPAEHQNVNQPTDCSPKDDIRTKYRIERTLYVDPVNDEVWTIDVYDEKAWPVYYSYEGLCSAVHADQARIIANYEPHRLVTLTDEELGEEFAKHIHHRDQAWKLIEPLLSLEIHDLFNRKTRGRLVKEQELKSRRHRNKIIFHLRRYWQRGCTKNALFPDWHECGKGEHKASEVKRGRPTVDKDEEGNSTGVNVTPDDLAIFRDGIKKHVHNDNPKNLSLTWKLTKEEFYTTGEYELQETKEGTVLTPILLPAQQIPTLEQFKYYFYKERDRGKEVIAQVGLDGYNRDYRPVLKSSLEEGPYPGALYQIDATIGDLYLVNDFYRERLIGRPVIYIVIDTFSRFITGFAVTLEGPSWMGARLALMDAFLNHGYCEALIGDNGEIKSYNANSLVNPLGLRVANATRFRADWKAIVEQNFRTIQNEYTDFVPGAVHPRRGFGHHDYRFDTRLSLSGFRGLMSKCVNNYNNNHRLEQYPMSMDMIAKKVKPTPSVIWEYGIKHLSGLLPGVEDEEKLRVTLLPKGRAAVHKGVGIYYKRLAYTCETAIRDGWFERHKGTPTLKFPIAIESTVDHIYLCMDHGKVFEKCVLTEPYKRFEGKDWYEVRDYFALKNIEKKRSATETQMATAVHHADINNLIAQEIAATERALEASGISNRERLQNIRESRNHIKDFERKFGPVSAETSAGAITPEKDAPPIASNIPLVQAHKPAAYVPPAQPIDELRAARERSRRKDD